MAGMLPGVESARRRRLHGSNGWSDSSSVISSGFGSPRSRLSHDNHTTPTSFLQKSMVNQSEEDGKLGGAAREAKERLDGRLRGHLKSDIKRQDNHERVMSSNTGRRPTPKMVMEKLGMEVFGLKKNGPKRFTWAKNRLGWKASSQGDCAICLDQFKTHERLTRLPCAHQFHSNCLLPWIESNAHCPCCRTTILGLN